MTDLETPHLRERILDEIFDERYAQDARWGPQNHPDGTNIDNTHLAMIKRDMNDKNNATGGDMTWKDILEEEFLEAVSEETPDRLRTELIQVAAVAVAWIECIDRREAKKASK